MSHFAYATSEEVATLIVRYTDTKQLEQFDNTNGMLADDKIRNLLQSEYDDGVIADILALDSEGTVIGRLTADEFFGERLGF